jgi:hypothetical protein
MHEIGESGHEARSVAAPFPVAPSLDGPLALLKPRGRRFPARGGWGARRERRPPFSRLPVSRHQPQ